MTDGGFRLMTPLEAAAALRSGRVVLLPTESSQALAASLERPDAVARVRALKGRAESGKPLLLLCSDVAMVETIAHLAPTARAAATALWPGAVTLVLPAREAAVANLLGARGIAVRVPGCEVARAVVAALGSPVTGTSANRASDPPLLEPDPRLASLPTGDDGVAGAVATADPLPGGPPSTLVDLTGDRPVVLRHGAVGLAALRAVPGLADLAGIEDAARPAGA